MEIPASRIRRYGPERTVRADGEYVVYWMLAQRRTRFNFGLQHAARRAR